MLKNKDAFIKILAERPIEYVELDIEMSEKARGMLINHALDNLLFDDDALINWAFIDIIKQAIEFEKKSETHQKINKHNHRDKYGKFARIRKK